MKGATVSTKIPAPGAEVFALLHDYERRLEWDTLLCEARLTGGFKAAEKGATSVCVGRDFFGKVAMETRYVSFEPGRLAAVELVGKPWFFEKFAASIRHDDVDGGSMITYKFRFAAKPRWLAWAMEPMMLGYLKHETAKRLEALASVWGRV
ncbi:SRPBCC family protein [Haloferula chungangensis]|uniref:SRPBCC family protein n=1 Tax=Haloferula chungangensis TaxID=1048331 RepID=A0ABW2LAT1_9BACT